MTLPLRQIPLVAHTVTAIGSAMRRKIFQFGMCLLVLGMVACLLPLGFSVGIIGGTVPEGIDVDLAANTFDSTVSGSHAHLDVPYNRRSGLSSAHTRRVTTHTVSRRSSIPGNNPQPIFQQNGRSIELERWLSNAIIPVKATFVFLC